METRASYTLVGAFVLALMVGMFIFLVWLARLQLNEEQQKYFVLFRSSVNGLVVGSPVRFKGVAIGKVTDIRIDPDNVEQVRVTLEVPSVTPIKTDAVASLEPVGITGGVYVEVSGGTQDAPLLKQAMKGTPIINSRGGALTELFNKAPQILANLVTLSERLNNMLSQENQQAVTATLANIAAATRGADLTVHNANTLVTELRRQVEVVGNQAQYLLSSTNRTVDKAGSDITTISAELARTSRELSNLTRSLGRTSDEIGQMVAENREPLRDFTNTGLYDFSRLLVNLQELSAKLSRVSGRLERDPSELIFGGKKGVEVK